MDAPAPAAQPAPAQDGAPSAASPWGAGAGAPATGDSSAPAALADESTGGDAPPREQEGPGGREGDHPLAVTSSPWETTSNVDAELLPSAAVLQAAAPAPEAPPVDSGEVASASSSSRLGMTIGLAIAAVALVAAVVYFLVTETGAGDDPADVKVGSEQQEYGDDPAPTATASAPAPKPKPKPIYRPPSKPKPKDDKPEDIYENL